MQCTSCPPHFMLEDGLCSECSGSQYYDPPTQLCKPCHASCRACSGPGPFSCSACMFPLHLDRKNTQCVSCCGPRPHDGCCSCNSDTGECHNLTPAEKRRTSVDSELDNLAAAESVDHYSIAKSSGIKPDATLFGYLALAMFASGLVVLSVIMVSIVSNKTLPPRSTVTINIIRHSVQMTCTSAINIKLFYLSFFTSIVTPT